MARFVAVPVWGSQNWRTINLDAVRDLIQVEPAPGRTGAVKTQIIFRESLGPFQTGPAGSTQDFFTSWTAVTVVNASPIGGE